MTKYIPLREYLQNLARLTGITLSFSELEKILGFVLCEASHNHRSWWGNDMTHPQARAWLDAGWKVVMVNTKTKKVIFQPIT